RLVEIAIALGLKPDVLLLDEPAAGVPSLESHRILQVLDNLPEHIAILIIEHDMDLVFGSRSASPFSCKAKSWSRGRRRRSPGTGGCIRSISASSIMPEALSLREVRAGYGETVVLEDIAFELPERGALAVLGRNGVGKTTLLATIMGHTTFHAGSIEYQGRPIAKLP